LLLLPLTLGWKLAVHLGISEEFKEQNASFKVAEFLTRQHFATTVAKDEDGTSTVRATAGLCRILVAKSASTGSDRYTSRQSATADDTVFVVFKGKIYPEQPVWLTNFDALWAKVRHDLGLNAQAAPVFVVIANKGCDAERLPWNELG